MQRSTMHLKTLALLATTQCFQPPQKTHQSVLLHAKGRGRAAKYHERRDAEQKYATRLLGLLTHERKEEERVAKERLEKWSDKRLEDAGLSLTGVRCARLPRGLYGRPVVRLEKPRRRGERAPPLLPRHHRFGSGDLCIVAPGTMGGCGAAEGTILKTGPRHVDVVLSSAQQADALAREPSARLDQCFSAVSYDRMRAAVEALTPNARGRDADDASAELRKVLTRDDAVLAAERAGGLTRRCPNDAAARRALHDVSGGELVDAQVRAAVAALTARVSLIQGPPGTGKTRTAAALLAAAVALRDRESKSRLRPEKRRRALACAVSNVAADNLLEALLRLNVSAVRVGHPAATREELRNHTLDAWALRLGGDDYARARPDARDEVRRRALLDADVVVASCVGAGSDALAPWLGLAPRPGQSEDFLDFGLVLVDEAAQATEPAALVPLAAAPRATQLVLVGDPCQLPPTVLSRDAGALRASLFQRLVGTGLRPRLLTTQYRMHPELNRFSSERFYGGAVRTCPAVEARRVAAELPAGFAWPNASAPLALVAVRGAESRESNADAASISNEAECAALVKVVRELLATVAERDIGVITPYAAQARLIRDALAGDVEVNTVDAYQGREKDVVLISTVRSNEKGNLGFVADDRRLNVALTRARRAVVVVGDPGTLASDDTWRAFVARCEEDGCCVEGPSSEIATTPPPVM